MLKVATALRVARENVFRLFVIIYVQHLSVRLVLVSANLLVLTQMLSLRADMPYLAQIMASVAYLAVMFSMSKFWVFRQRNTII